MSDMEVKLSSSSVPIPSLNIYTPSFTRFSRRSIDINTASPLSNTSSPTTRTERNIFKATEDAFEEAQRQSIRRQFIAKEYSKALDEVSDRMREAKMDHETDELIAAFAHVLRMFALGDQALSVFQELNHHHQFRPSLPQSPAPDPKSYVFKHTSVNPSKKTLKLAQSPTVHNLDNDIIPAQPPNDQLNKLARHDLSPQDVINDVYVNDKPYCIGWSKVSSQYRCKQRRGCNCAVTGECLREVFYNYLVDDTMLRDNLDLLKKHCVIEVSGSNPETLHAEEIRVSRRSLGIAYAYYARNIVNPTGQTTLLSISTHIYKSVCFTADCVVLAVSKDRVQDYGVVIDTQVSGKSMAWVMCMRQDVIDAIVKAVSNIGREPVLPESGSLCISYKDDTDMTQTIKANFSNTYSRAPHTLINGKERIIMRDVIPTTSSGIFEVGTARATITVSLSPCLQKEGKKNPSSRILEYLVHAISCDT